MGKQRILLSIMAVLTVCSACGAAEFPQKRRHEDDEHERSFKKLRLINELDDQPNQREYDDEKSEELRLLAKKIKSSNLEAMAPRIMSLVKRGANPNCADIMETSLLRRYVQGDNLEVVTLLLERKANVNKQDYLALSTPLFSAKSASMVELLLNKGADVECRDRDGESALHYISALGRGKPVEVLMTLCHAGMDAKTVNEHDENALNSILGRLLYGRIKNNEGTCLKMAGVLCWYGVDRSSINNGWERPDLKNKKDAFIARLNTLVETFPHKKEEKRALLAAVGPSVYPHLNGAKVLVDLVAAYLVALDLSMEEVNSWGALPHND